MRSPSNNRFIKIENEDVESSTDENMKNSHEEIDEPSLIPETIIKVEINEKSDEDVSASSPVSNPESPKLAPPKNHSPLSMRSPASNVIQMQNSSPPMLSPNGSRYCTTCDISFNYANTFLAHKKFYCKANKVVVDRPSNGPSPNATSNVVVSLPAETSVL